jgi:HD-like signal output (HDOD) protein
MNKANKAFAPKVDLEKIIQSEKLPGLPQSAVRLLELSRDLSNGPAEFAAPIEVDVGLAGQVLKFVNSSYFGFVREISSVKMGIALVGIRTIKNFILWSAVFSLIQKPHYGPFELSSLWQDSLRRALLAKALVKLMGVKEADDVFSAALMQDMAIPVLAKASPPIYIKLLSSRDNGQIRLSALENQVFGWTHAHAGAMMARHWNLPENMANLIENHTAIETLAENPGQAPDMTAVALSAFLANIADPAWTECRQFEAYYDKLLPPDKPALVELLGQIDGQFDEFAPMMRIPTPVKSLVECYSEAAKAAPEACTSVPS